MTEESQKLDDNQFVYSDGVNPAVIVTVHANYKDELEYWRFTSDKKDFQSDVVKTLNPALYEKVQTAAVVFCAERKEIVAKRLAEEKLKKLAANMVLHQQFEHTIQTFASILLTLKYKFGVPSDTGPANSIRFDVANKSITLSFEEDYVWHGRSYYAHKDSKGMKFIVEDSNYKKRKFIDIAKAAKRVLELATEYESSFKAKNVFQEALETFAKSTGMKLATEWHRTGDKGHEGYYTYHLIPANSKYDWVSSSDYNIELTHDSNNIISGYRVKWTKPIKLLGRICRHVEFSTKMQAADDVKLMIAELSKISITEEEAKANGA